MSVGSATCLLQFFLQRGDPSGEAAEQRRRRGRRLRRLHHRLIAGAGVLFGHLPSFIGELLRRFRATLFQIERDGPEGKRWGSSPNVLSSMYGFANFVAMVDLTRGRLLRERVQAILLKYPPKKPGTAHGPR